VQLLNNAGCSWLVCRQARCISGWAAGAQAMRQRDLDQDARRWVRARCDLLAPDLR